MSQTVLGQPRDGRNIKQAGPWSQVVVLVGGALGHGLAAPEEDSLSTGEPEIRDNLQVCHSPWCQGHHPQKHPGKAGDPIVYNMVCSIPGCWFLQDMGVHALPTRPFVTWSMGLSPWTYAGEVLLKGSWVSKQSPFLAGSHPALLHHSPPVPSPFLLHGSHRTARPASTTSPCPSNWERGPTGLRAAADLLAPAGFSYSQADPPDPGGLLFTCSPHLSMKTPRHPAAELCPQTSHATVRRS